MIHLIDKRAIRILVLELIEEVLQGAEHVQLAKNDESGCYTIYLVDSERLRSQIQDKLKVLRH